MYRMALYLQYFSEVHILDARDIIVKISSDHHAYLQKFQWFPMEYKTGKCNREGHKINQDKETILKLTTNINKGPICIKMGNIHTLKRSFLVSGKT